MGLFGDLIDIATAPMKVVVEVAEVVVKPIAEVANEIVDEFEDFKGL